MTIHNQRRTHRIGIERYSLPTSDHHRHSSKVVVTNNQFTSGWGKNHCSIALIVIKLNAKRLITPFIFASFAAELLTLKRGLWVGHYGRASGSKHPFIVPWPFGLRYTLCSDDTAEHQTHSMTMRNENVNLEPRIKKIVFIGWRKIWIKIVNWILLKTHHN